MKGLIYIAGAVKTLGASTEYRGWLPNDPHFWTNPPTWGICRNDLRRKTDVGDYVFFVLGKGAELPQMIFGYMRVAEKISHTEAYHRADLVDKRMGNKNPNGNIIIDDCGAYNRFDAGVHRDIFDKIKREYVVGDSSCSRFHSPHEIKMLAPEFPEHVRNIFGRGGDRPIDIISRYGTELTEPQVTELLKWLEG